MNKYITILVLTIILVLNTNKAFSEKISIQEDPQNELGLLFTAKKIEGAKKLIQDGKYEEAKKILKESSEWLTTGTEYHYSLYKVLTKQQNTLETQKSKIEKAHALDWGKVRDEAYFLLATILIKEKNFKEALKLLIEVINSEPDSQLGHNAYKTLQDLKFSDKP